MRTLRTMALLVGVTLATVTTRVEASEDDDFGWGAFGGQLGFATGVSASAVLLPLAFEQESLGLNIVAGLGSLLGTAALTGLGVMGTPRLAESLEWNPVAGYALAAGTAGLVAGAWLGLGVARAIDPRAPMRTLLIVAGASALSLAVLGAFSQIEAPTPNARTASLAGYFAMFILSGLITYMAWGISGGDDGGAAPPAVLIVPAGLSVGTYVVGYALGARRE